MNDRWFRLGDHGRHTDWLMNTCQHCGEDLPSIVDAYCPYCSEALEESALIPDANEISDPISVPGLTGTLKLDPKLDLPDVCVLCAATTGRRQVVYTRAQNETRKIVTGQFLKRLFDVGGPLLRIFLNEAFDERPLLFRLPVCERHSNLNLPDVVDVVAIGNLKHSRTARGSNVHPDFVTAVSEFSAKRWEHLA